MKIVHACPKGLSTVWPKPHCRTPGFVFGVAGEVERVAGVFSDPGISALGLVGEDGADTRAPTQGIARSQNCTKSSIFIQDKT